MARRSRGFRKIKNTVTAAIALLASTAAASYGITQPDSLPACAKAYIIPIVMKVAQVYGWADLDKWIAQLDLSGLSGRPRVIDGDTIDINGTRIRLFGIDAPEKAQNCKMGGTTISCGEASTARLNQIIGNQIVKCTEQNKDRYGRTVAICVAGKVDIAERLVSDGWALAYTDYSKKYVVHEASAKVRGIGIWAGEFENPADYRRNKRG